MAIRRAGSVDYHCKRPRGNHTRTNAIRRSFDVNNYEKSVRKITAKRRAYLGADGGGGGGGWGVRGREGGGPI